MKDTAGIILLALFAIALIYQVVSDLRKQPKFKYNLPWQYLYGILLGVYSLHVYTEMEPIHLILPLLMGLYALYSFGKKNAISNDESDTP